MARSMPMPPQDFIANKPFVFAIKSKSTGLIYFTGRVAKLGNQPQREEL